MRIKYTDFSSLNNEPNRNVPTLKETFLGFFGQINRIVKDSAKYDSPATIEIVDEQPE